jgi:hypothetical protein
MRTRRARPEVLDDLLSDNRRQLERLLALYLAGDFPREALTDRKSRLERTIADLEEERTTLLAQMEAGELSETQIRTLSDFVRKVAAGIEVGNADFETRRAVILALNVEALLYVKDGHRDGSGTPQKWARVSCILAPDKDYNLRPVSAMV